MHAEGEAIGERAAEAYRTGASGDFADSERCIAELEGDPSAEANAWVLALRAQRWHAQPDKGSLPTRSALEAFVHEAPSARNAAVLACTEAIKKAIIGHRVDELDAWTELQQRLAVDSDDGWALAWTKMSLAWFALAKGQLADVEKLAEEAQALASNHGIAPALIEATVIRSLCAEALGDVVEATALARRSSRMARTEDLPQWQYLANLVLARMRRLNGLPHLTTRILRPLHQVAPASWHGWIAWEALMAGALGFGTDIELDDANDPSGEVRGLQRFVDSAARGNAAEFQAAAEALSALGSAWSSRTRDGSLALAAVDARIGLDGVDPELSAWCAGRDVTPPAVIRGLCIDLESDRSDPGPAAFVVSGPMAGPTRRVAGLGERVVETDARVRRVRGTAERTPTTLAAMALGGEQGLLRADLFRMVYGFDYDQGVHRGLFKSLIYRVRKDLGDWGELRAEGDDRYVLELNRTLVIPDPRCEQSLEDVVLRTLGRSGAQSAKEAATHMGVPLRTAQKMLKRLVDDGALIVERVANDVTYRIEDTTFSEPTKWS